ncbi:MAG: pantoate--beta-alanine ligase, partial [Planctomycetota bacterium]
QPAAVTLGQKDYQQLCVVRSMVEDLLLPIEVLAVPTVREDDGLAMSSRNRYLDGQTRKHALGLSKALRQAVRLVADGEADPAVLESIMHETMAAHHVEVDYAAVRSARDLAKPDNVSPDDAVALVAGRVGEVRLIDNMPLG